MTDPIKSAKDTAGLALYLEFRKPNYTYQLIITQPVINLDGKPSRARTLKRRMNAFQARKNWHFDAIGSKPTIEIDGKFEQIATENAQDLAGRNLTSVFPLLNQLFHGEYALYQKPVMVEFTYEEFAQIKQSKTPAGLIRRIQRTRVAQGFGEELVDSATPATV